MTLPDDIPLIPEPSEEYLNQRQYHDYAAHREAFLEWLAAFGKSPGKAEGYAAATVKNTAYRTDKVYRWVWERQDRYTTNITHAREATEGSDLERLHEFRSPPGPNYQKSGATVMLTPPQSYDCNDGRDNPRIEAHAQSPSDRIVLPTDGRRARARGASARRRGTDSDSRSTCRHRVRGRTRA